MTAMGVEDTAEVRAFGPGDVVKVRIEAWPSMVLSPDQADWSPDDGPDLPSTCCVPIVLIRTPADDENGRRRWVEIRDLTLWRPD